ncbi:MAG: 50S ribosomal protein L18 [Euryarchaeota archaeon]|jgi:large subunit ribosomal protein L18|nr:50S ribosomal protein L18 [Euryarchaeota archaeon]MBT5183546.1 50S ribosomal protein L18 [Euryarchaeota archaeon]
MAKGPRQRNQYRRRLSGETDYRRRLKLLKSGNARAVVRISNTRAVCQVVNWMKDGDKVEISVTGDDLVSRYGWPEANSRKNIPASYLVGYALGKSAIAAGHDEAVLDIGLAASTTGNRVFAALKGMIDAGLELPHGESVLPSDDRINGAHIDESYASVVEATKSKIEEAF